MTCHLVLCFSLIQIEAKTCVPGDCISEDDCPEVAAIYEQLSSESLPKSVESRLEETLLAILKAPATDTKPRTAGNSEWGTPW